jgi:hypothetical protein
MRKSRMMKVSILACSLVTVLFAHSAFAGKSCQERIEAQEDRLLKSGNIFVINDAKSALAKLKDECGEKDKCLDKVKACWDKGGDLVKKMNKCIDKELPKSCKTEEASDECCSVLKDHKVSPEELSGGVPYDLGKKCNKLPYEGKLSAEAAGNNSYYGAFHSCKKSIESKGKKAIDKCTDKIKACSD